VPEPVSSVPPARHNTDEPVDVVTALENLLRAQDEAQNKRMLDHEAEEKRIATELADKVEALEGKRVEDAKRAANERAVLAKKLDDVSAVVEGIADPKVGLAAVFREVAASIADPFLARDDERKRQVEALEREVSELKTEVNAQLLNHSRFLAEQGRKIDALEVAIRELKPKSVDDVR